MRKSDREKFCVCITALAEAFRVESSKTMLQAYWLGLNDLEITALETACWRAMRECEFMPTAKRLRDLAGELTPQTRAALAWEIFRRAVATIGSAGSVRFDDPVVNAVVRNLGGWISVCRLEGDQFDVWLRKDFERRYVDFLTSGRGSLEHHVGEHEKDNRLRGYVGEWNGIELNPVRQIACGLPSHSHPRLARMEREGAKRIAAVENLSNQLGMENREE